MDSTVRTLAEKVAVSIERLKHFEPPEGYYLAFSGGKDSIVIYTLAQKAGVNFDAHFNLTSVDPPEVVRFVRSAYPDVQRHPPKHTMWWWIIKKGFPPTPKVRYCCDKLKERGGKGRFVVAGIRWAESPKRAKYPMLYKCAGKNKWMLRPIIDWTDVDVWDFIHAEGIPYCSLYDEGFKRIGCIMCPLAQQKNRKMDEARWPKYAQKYLKAFDRMMQARNDQGKVTDLWTTGQDVYEWWLNQRFKRKEIK